MKIRRIETALTILFLSLAVVPTGCKRRAQHAPEANSATPSGQPAAGKSEETTTSFGWTLDNNQRAKLSDYQGKVVVLDFYATWCVPCRAETPHLVQLQRQYGEQGLQIIGLNVGGEDDREQVPAYAKEFGIQYPLGFPDNELADSYLSDNQNIPQAFVFDRGGRLVKRFLGYNRSIGQELERVVQTSLAPAQ